MKIEAEVKMKAVISPQTQLNLMKAMHAEAFAFVKYSLFADEARQNGRNQEKGDRLFAQSIVARFFKQAAHTERREKFAKLAELTGLLGNDNENLCDAILDASHEVDNMYRGFAEQAAAAGDHEAAEHFRELGRDEAKHREAFESVVHMVDYVNSRNPAAKTRTEELTCVTA